MTDKIAEIVIQAVPEIRVTKRKEQEQEARDIIVKNLGALTAEQLALFFEKADTDYWEDKSKQGRFGVTFLGNNRKLICENLAEANKWIKDLWTAPLNECIALVDRFMKESPIKGAKYGFPSLILYLRDPERFNLWITVMREGIEKITGESFVGDSGADYEKLNTAINQFRDQYKLAPQALDIVLTVLCMPPNNSKTAQSGTPVSAEESEPLFTADTFSLLAKLTANPVVDTYQKNKEAIKSAVEIPLQTLIRKAAAKLPKPMSDILETEKKIFARILKNDYGQGGAWDYYWGALYPKGGKRNTDAQLFVWVNNDRIEFGFYVGDYGDVQKKRFIANAKAHTQLVEKSVASLSGDENLLFGVRNDSGKEITSCAEWLSDISPDNICVRVEIKAEEVVGLSRQNLVQRVSRLFEGLFPFVLMTSSDDPFDKIAAVIDDESEIELQPEFSIAMCSSESGLDEDTLNRWVRAIDRKGQAVVYGPPGTGKTYTARLLAKHLVSGSDGFIELIQFHPAYSYEDFIQGIRPKPGENGGLCYPIVPGRFLDFCNTARQRKGLCVLILDEINRANLSRVFGELMYLLEYRDETIPLAAGEVFSLPGNVRLIGTMNTADRSIALVDHALRRRFAFLELSPNYGVLEKFHGAHGNSISELVDTLQRVNKQIRDPHYMVGISFFMRGDLKDQIEDIWCMEIEPYLDEYFFDQPTKTDEFRWEKLKNKALVA